MSRIASVTRNQPGVWTYALSGTPPFRVYLNGILHSSTSEESISIPSIEEPVVEVLDSTDEGEPESRLHPSFGVIQWRNTGAAAYRIEKLEGSTWVQADIVGGSREPYLRYDTPVLPDGQTTRYRVSAVDEMMTLSTPRLVEIETVRHPDSPSVSFAVEDGILTIDA